MKTFFSLISILCFTTAVFAQATQTWYRVQFDPADTYLQVLEKAGVIEAESHSNRSGWMTKRDFEKYAPHFRLTVLGEENRPVIPLTINSSADTLGQVLAIYPLPPQVESVRGLGYDGEYFYLADADINNEKIHKLDPNNNFAVVNTFPSPGPGGFLPWGVASDGQNLYIADAIQDKIYKTDTTGTVLGSIPTGGPIATGLGYRQGVLWNADLGQFSPPIPPRVYKSDTLGTLLGSHTLTNTVNGVAAHDSAIFISRNKNNGQDILAMNPQNFTVLYSFPSPLEFPNGLAFDGQYLWTCGNHLGQRYIVQIDLGINPSPPEISFSNFELVADGMYNNRFNAAFDGQGNVHVVYATQFQTVSSTKEIMYATNKSGVWELTAITQDATPDELPNIRVDANDVVHIMWHGYSPGEGDTEVFYTNNATGQFSPKIQITSKALDGLEGHTWPDFAIDPGGTLHIAFLDAPIGIPELYYITYSPGAASLPVNISNNTSNDTDPRVLLDLQQHPHIFWNNYASGLNHASNVSGNWQSEFITGMGITRPAAAIDGQGVIHFAVTDGPDVKYGNNAGGSFSVKDTIATHAADCFYPQVAVDGADVLHLTYHAFGDSLNTWPGNGEIFYANNLQWEADKFPQNISQLPNEQEIYPGLAAAGNSTLFVGWGKTGFSRGLFSNIRIATTLPDSGGFLAGRINVSDDYHFFGYVPPLDSAFWSFEIYNHGVRPLAISGISWETQFDPWFEVITDFSGPQALDWGDTLLVNVTAIINQIVENDTVLLDGHLRISSDDPLEPLKGILLEVETEPLGSGSGEPAVIRENQLFRNYPNPFNPSTNMGFRIADRGFVKLEIFDVSGRKTVTLVNKELPPGEYEVLWDGRDESGILQSSGIYFYRLKIGENFVKTKRMILLK